MGEEDRLAEEDRVGEEARVAEEARLAEEARRAEEARVAEEARIQAELEAGAAAKQAYWDAHADIPNPEDKIIPDLPEQQQAPLAPESGNSLLSVKVLIGVAAVLSLLGAFFVL